MARPGFTNGAGRQTLLPEELVMDACSHSRTCPRTPGAQTQPSWQRNSVKTSQGVNGYSSLRALCCRASKVSSSFSFARQYCSFSIR